MIWALEDAVCPTPSSKLVLAVFANWVDASGSSWLAATTIARKTGLDIKTVRASIDLLEEARLIVDTGERKGRTGQVKVYKLLTESHPEVDSFDEDHAQEAHDDPQSARTAPRRQSRPKADTLHRGRKAPVFPAKGTQKRETDPVTEPSTPKDAIASLPPAGGVRARGKPISREWSPPPIARLPTHARTIAEQWPIGAYEAQAEAFRSAGLASGRGKRDWNAAWASEIVRLGAKPIRDGKAGVTFATSRQTTAEPVDDARQLEQCEERASFFESIGREDDAAAWRTKAEIVRRRLAA